MKPAKGLQYMSGFGNEFATEALAGTLPEGQNSPQRVAHGLYAEQLSGSAFTVPQKSQRRSWLYRIRPSAMHGTFRRIDDRAVRGAPMAESEPTPNRYRWDPQPIPDRCRIALRAPYPVGDADAARQGIDRLDRRDDAAD